MATPRFRPLLTPAPATSQAPPTGDPRIVQWFDSLLAVNKKGAALAHCARAPEKPVRGYNYPSSAKLAEPGNGRHACCSRRPTECSEHRIRKKAQSANTAPPMKNSQITLSMRQWLQCPGSKAITKKRLQSAWLAVRSGAPGPPADRRRRKQKRRSQRRLRHYEKTLK